jgi:hypothetical protein
MSSPGEIGGRVRNFRHIGVPAVPDALMVSVVVPDVLTVVDGTEQVTPVKLLETLHANETVPVKPRIAPTVIVEVVDPPA